MEYYTSIFQNMATSDREFKTNLSEELSPKESEKRSVACEKIDVAIRNDNDPEACSGDSTVDRNKVTDLGKDDQGFMNERRKGSAGNIDCDSNNTACKSLATEKQDCGSTKSEEGQKLDGFDKSHLPSPRCGGRRVDEALLEEDEVECSGDEEEHYESAEEEHYTPEEAEERMKEALELKKEGNDHFRNQEYAEGKDLYTKAIKRCPKEFKENKSIFYANRAACFQKLEDYENAISDCSKALELAPNYLKARLRRAQCYEKVEKLEEALEDYKIVFENDKSCQPAREAILRLPEEIKIKHEKLKEEMIGKLKDLGNMVLRPFGLSTDNFKLQQDPNSGGYSINFQK